MGCNGNHRRYRRGCPGCQTRGRAYDRHRRGQMAAGTWLPAVPAAAARDHVAALRAAGMTVRAIGLASGLATPTLYDLINQRRASLHGCTAAAIMAVQPAADPVLPANMVPPTATVRMIRALVADGHSLSSLAARLDRTVHRAWMLANERMTAVTVETERAVADLYDDLALTPGTGTRARNMARTKGWHPREAWTDDTIGDPTAKPFSAAGPEDVDRVLVERVAEGRRPFADLNDAEQVELWRVWERHRKQRMESPGLKEFQLAHGLTKAQVSALRNAAAGLNTKGNPIRKKATAALAA